MTPHDDAVALARAYLSRVCEPGHLALWALVTRVGPVEAAARVKAADVVPEIARATQARRLKVDAEADLVAGAARGIRFRYPEHPEWPQLAVESAVRAGSAASTDLKAVTLAPPIALWVRGDTAIDPLLFRSVSIVGARAATSYGERVTAELAYGLARAGVTVVSGGAYGIDAVAHRSAISAGSPTVVVSAAGLDRPYPVGNTRMFEQVVEGGGLLISESPPGAAPHRSRFLSRNRLIAAFGSGTVVVEAARRSGALNTAAHARALARPVMAVPGPVTSAMSRGCHDLLRRPDNPAVLVGSVDEVLTEIGAYSDAATSTGGRAGGSWLDELDDRSRAVYDGLPVREAVTEDQLAYLSGVPVAVVLRCLPRLQAVGAVLPAPGGGWFRARGVADS